MGRWLVVVLGVLLILSAPRLYTATAVNIGTLATLKQLASKGLPGWGNYDPFWQGQTDIAAANVFFEQRESCLRMIASRKRRWGVDASYREMRRGRLNH